MNNDSINKSKSILLEDIKIFSVSGKGKSKSQAIENAFNKMKTYVYKRYNDLIISIETVDIFKSIKKDEKKTREKNKKIFFNDIKIFLDIKVKVKFMKEGQI